MSPLSIAQYLDTHEYESYFDYVIFDGAGKSSEGRRCTWSTSLGENTTL